MGKIQTPDWILNGKDKPGLKKVITSPEKNVKAKKQSGKSYRIRQCPKCGSDDVAVVLGKESGVKGEWECKKCGWRGTNIIDKEVSEDEFLEYLDRKGVEVPDEAELKKDFKKTIDTPDEEDIEE